MSGTKELTILIVFTAAVFFGMFAVGMSFDYVKLKRDYQSLSVRCAVMNPDGY